ncbi:M48 family metalloprotease [Candidatus Sumerlaeota bacterium]|nr:M48 family metalloprotease [Candidatus Sumerlaeota bacterium]
MLFGRVLQVEWPDIEIKGGIGDSSRAIADRPLPPEVEAILRKRREVIEAVEGKIEPVRVSLLYRAGLVVVAAAMITLPLIYFAIIVGVGYGTYYYATHATGIFQSVRSARVALLAYITPILTGGILVLTMLKPILAPAGRRPPSRVLDSSEQRQLFGFVEKVCRAIGAPIPKRIEVNCEVNASASFRGGYWSLLSNDLVLTIGLPLASALNLRQFAGILAHEFGHFTQGTAMRLLFIISRINLWFARVVYSPDALDQALDSVLGGGSAYGAIIILFVRMFMLLTRGILWCLMTFGHLISCFMLRQMEYDADRYEARLAGSEVFVESSLITQVLCVAEGAAYHELKAALKQRQLADDLPMLIFAHYRSIPYEVKTKIADTILTRKTGLFDTHPSDAQRIASAQRENAPGIFKIERPARDIFEGFDDLARSVTLKHYQAVLGPLVKQDFVIPTAQFLSRPDRPSLTIAFSKD